MNGNEIKQFRKLNKWTQQQLAEKIGVSRQTINYWENGMFEPRKIHDKMLEYLRENKR